MSNLDMDFAHETLMLAGYPHIDQTWPKFGLFAVLASIFIHGANLQEEILQHEHPATATFGDCLDSEIRKTLKSTDSHQTCRWG